MAQTVLMCPDCDSTNVVRAGKRLLRDGSVTQRFTCDNCGIRFSDPTKIRKSMYPIEYVGKYAMAPERTSGASKNLPEKAFILANDQPIVNSSKHSLRFPASMDQLLVDYLLYMKRQGYADGYIQTNVKLIKRLIKLDADLHTPNNVKTVIAQQSWCPGRKSNACDAYSLLLKMQGATWDRPRYKHIAKIPFVPLEKEIDQLIDGSSERIGCFLQLLKETGARPGEAWQLRWEDIDTERRTLRIKPKKGSNPRILKISPKLVTMLSEQSRHYAPRIFSFPHMDQEDHRRGFMRQRKRIAHKTKNPRLLQISFKTFRHWKGTTEYHRTKDILHVMHVLGHKNIKNTLIYVRLAETIFQDVSAYITRVTRSARNARILLEAGFEYVLEMDGLRIFRKPKQEH